MSIIIKSGTSEKLAAVNDANELQVGLSPNPVAAGFVKLSSATGNPINVATSGYLYVGQDQLIFADNVDGSSLNTNLWNLSASTMQVTQTIGVITLNANGSSTTNASAQLNSVKHIPLHGAHPVAVTITAATNVGAQPNATRELGIGLASGNSAPTDGAFFRWASNGTFVAVMSYGGVETVSEPLPVPTNDVAHQYIVYIENDRVFFIVDMMPLVTMTRPAMQPFPVASSRLPIFARVYNGTLAPNTAPRLYIGQSIAIQSILNQNRPWDAALTGIGRGSYQSPVPSYSQTANHANSTTPSTATLSNTTASYSTLGGRFVIPSVAGSATDYALFAYQVPAGYQLFLTGVMISAMNIGAANAAIATIMDWSLGLNGSAVPLATADSVGTAWATRRLPLGLMSVGSLGAVGTPATPNLDRVFDTPVVVDSGRYLHVILAVPVATATGGQQIRGAVTFNGYFE
jgi:hypothetical protein